MSKLVFSKMPQIISKIEMPHWDQFCFVQDMLIHEPNDLWRVPEQFLFLIDLLPLKLLNQHSDLYWYISAKHMPVAKGSTGFSRPGWHIDGYGSDDITFIWSDSHPTQFCHQVFTLSEDHNLSMEEMRQQAHHLNIVDGEANCLYMLDASCVHRASRVHEFSTRKFFKLTLSKSMFNLKGNTLNPEFTYDDWTWRDRSEERNVPGL